MAKSPGQTSKSLHKAYSRSAFPFSQRSRSYAGYHNVVTVFPVFQPIEDGKSELRFVVAVEFCFGGKNP